MKKNIIFLSLLVIAGISQASPVFYWGSNGGLNETGGDVYDRSNALIAQGSDWLVELINVANETVLFFSTGGFADAAGEFYADAVDAEGWNGIEAKTVIYNGNTKIAATHFAEFSQRYTFTWGNPAPASLGVYNAGSVASNQWQAIPEPTVVALIGLFGGGLLITKRLFSKD